MSLSILIVCHDEPSLIERLAPAIRSARRFHVPFFVFANAPTSPVRESLHQLQVEWGDAFHLIENDACTISQARQKLLGLASTDWILFWDPDCEPKSDPISTALEIIAQSPLSPHLAGLTGPIQIYSKGGDRFLEVLQRQLPSFAQTEQFVRPEDPRRPTHLPCFALYRRDALRAVGGFCESMRNCGEDLEVGFRLRAAGFHFERRQELSFKHFTETTPLAEWLKKIFRFGTARALVLARYPWLSGSNISRCFLLGAALELVLMLFWPKVFFLVLPAQFLALYLILLIVSRGNPRRALVRCLHLFLTVLAYRYGHVWGLWMAFQKNFLVRSRRRQRRSAPVETLASR